MEERAEEQVSGTSTRPISNGQKASTPHVGIPGGGKVVWVDIEAVDVE